MDPDGVRGARSQFHGRFGRCARESPNLQTEPRLHCATGPCRQWDFYSDQALVRRFQILISRSAGVLYFLQPVTAGKVDASSRNRCWVA